MQGWIFDHKAPWTFLENPDGWSMVTYRNFSSLLRHVYTELTFPRGRSRLGMHVMLDRCSLAHTVAL